MDMLKQAAAFVWQYYGIYAWVGVTGLTAVLTCRLAPCVRRCGTKQKAALYVLLVFVCCLVSYAALKTALPLPGAAAMAVKLVLAAAATAGAACVLALFVQRPVPARLRVFFSEHRWGAAVFAVLTGLYLLQRYGDTPIDAYTVGWYVADYSHGVGPRSLLGTLLNALQGGRSREAFVYSFWAATVLAIIVTAAVLADRVLRRAEGARRGGSAFLLLCFLACPGSLTALWAPHQQGRLETYTLLLCVWAAMAFRRLPRAAGYGLLAAVGCLCNAVYQGSVFLYFPILLMVLLADIFAAPDARGAVRRALAGAAACVPAALSFLFFQFFARVHYATADEMFAAVQQSTDIDLSEWRTALRYELFVPLSDAYLELNVPFLNEDFPREKTLLFLLLLLPLIVLLTALYLKCFALVRAAGKSPWGTPYPWYLLVLLCALPQFLLNIDWGRWQTALIIDIVFGVLWLADTGFAEMRAALSALGRRVERHRFAAGLAVLYLASLDRFHAAAFPVEAVNLWERVRTLFA